MNRMPLTFLSAMAIALVAGTSDLAAQAAATAPETVKFAAKSHEVGTKFTVNRQSTMAMDMGGMVVKGTDTQVFQVEVLGPQKLRIVVEKNSETNENPFAGEETAVSDLQSKTLILELVDGVMKVVGEDGKALAADKDVKKLQSLVASLLGADPLSKHLREKPITLGEAQEMPKAVVQDMMGMEEGEADWVKKFEVTLTGTEERDGTPCGVFSVNVAMEMSMDPSMPPMTCNLTGSMCICTQTGRMVAQTMGGPMSLDAAALEGAPAGFKMSGKLGFEGSSTIQR